MWGDSHEHRLLPVTALDKQMKKEITLQEMLGKSAQIEKDPSICGVCKWSVVAKDWESPMLYLRLLRRYIPDGKFPCITFRKCWC